MFNGDSCGVISAIHEQSSDINQGVDRVVKSTDFETLANAQGAGDQGMMFGYATNETENYMPLALDLAHNILKELSTLRRTGVISYLRPDAKSQVTIEYSDDHKPVRIDTIVVSTQHDDFDEEEAMLAKIKKDIIEILIPKVKETQKPEIQALFNDQIQFHINPTGMFVIGGPVGDCGLTGRKIIVDTYGGMARHGGGAFSGKDPSKVDRSAAYAGRYVAKNIVAAGLADKCEIQVSYAIGVAEPTSISINTFNTAKVADELIIALVREHFDLRPYGITNMLNLLQPMYKQTAAYGHFGRQGSDTAFTWEKTDKVEALKASAGL